MASSTEGSASTSIEYRPWITFPVQGTTYLIKGTFTNNCYSVLLSDLGVIWEEKITEEQLLERSKLLNSYIEAPSSVIIQTLSQRLVNGPLESCTYNIKFSENSLKLFVSGPLQGKSGPQYEWNFNFTVAPSLILREQLILPLLAMSVELFRQKNKLINIIDKKDKEIKDYKENGSVISRKHLETIPFVESVFDNDLIRTKEFQVSISDPLKSLDSSWQELYTSIVSTASTTKEESSHVSPVKSPPQSSRKRPLIVSPSKDIEKMRRLELEKQLEDGKDKIKKKKKKLL